MNPHDKKFSRPSDSDQNHYTPDMAEELDTLPDQWLEMTKSLTREEAVRFCALLHQKILGDETHTLQARSIARVVGMLILKDNIALQMCGLSFAVGLHITQGESMTEKAKELGVTRAAVSKVSNWWADYLGLPRSSNMKSQQARKSYSETQKKNHWRRKLTRKDFGPGCKTNEQLKDDKL